MQDLRERNIEWNKNIEVLTGTCKEYREVSYYLGGAHVSENDRVLYRRQCLVNNINKLNCFITIKWNMTTWDR